MTHPSNTNSRTLPLRKSMKESEVDRPPRLGSGWYDLEVRGAISGEDTWVPPPTVVRDPIEATLIQGLEQASGRANRGCRRRLVETLPADPIMAHAHGIMEDNGLPEGTRWGYSPNTSAVGVAWFTRGGVKCVRVWGYRCFTTGAEHSFLFIPEPSDQEGIRCCWASVYPRRFFRLHARRQERIRRLLERVGPPGEDDRVNLSLAWARIRAHVPGLGVILSDDLARTQMAQVVVRDPSTGFRHHLSVPPRFGNPRTKTFRELRTAEARIHAAVAWTFGMRPDEYEPALEA